MTLKRISALAASAALLAGLGSAATAQVVTVKGSDTMVILAQRWAEEYMKKHPGVRIQVTGGGSGTGIAALINGTTDICNASRPMKDKEKANVRQRHNRGVSEYRVAKDGITIYVHPSNNVPHLTLDQLRLIYTGRINNWKQVGGPDRPITRYSRENNSGTYVFFKEFVLKNQNYDPSCQNMPGTASVVNAVSKDPGGIGYGGMAYAKGVREVPIKKDAKSQAYEPTPANVRNGNYPIWRFLYQYVVGVPKGEVAKLIQWELSDEGQAIVEKVGFVPVK